MVLLGMKRRLIKRYYRKFSVGNNWTIKERMKGRKEKRGKR